MKIALAALLALTPVSAVASPVYTGNDSQPGYSNQRTCFKTEYREEYIPGTEDNPGYVKSWKDTFEVPCKGVRWRNRPHWRPHYPTPIDDENVGFSPGYKEPPSYRRHVTVYEDVDTNDCSEGTIAGGILGGGLATAISRGKDQWWAIPTGIITGAMIGCDIDGG
tara:strand:+ start:240 stop:734 length:495 start_codon:yes stop_codon:yes gene_type:complete